MAMNKWIPETNPMILRRVGKTGEEAAELVKVCCRITIQGMSGVDSETGKSNTQALCEEIADVMAQCQVTIKAFGLSGEFIADRIHKKEMQMAEWESKFKDGE